MHVEITDSWDKYLEKYEPEDQDIYYQERYVKEYEDTEAKALCIICEEGDNILLMPFLRKAYGPYYDFETPYGYGGPIANNRNQAWINEALDLMKKYFEQENYICGFLRFHPLLNNADYCKEAMTVIYDRKTVYINTEDNADDIWAKQITSKNRNMIRKAEKNELVFKAEYDFASMKKFVELYNGTMKRLEADDFYFFDEAYYEKMEEDFKDHAFLGTVWLGEQLICSAIFFYDGVYGHYHLEGSNHEYSKLAANNFLLWNVAQEMHKLGVKKFHLGGGYDANPENSLLKFKKSFSPNEGDFYIGKWMFNQEVYNQVVADWVAKNPEKDAIYGNRLLKYRY
jgi:hypothetical protein